MAGVQAAVHAAEEKRDERLAAARERFRRSAAKIRSDYKGRVAAIRQGATELSDDGVEFIASWEGLRLSAYVDAVGVLTIGYGHTGSDVRPGMEITKERALALLERDATTAEKAVDRLITVRLSQRQFDCLVSFTFNCGVGALEDSALRALLNSGRYETVPAQLMRWVNGPNGPIQGLVNRRRAEAALWRKGTS